MKELISSELTIRGCTNTLQVGQQFGNFKALADYFAITYKSTSTNTVKSLEKELRQYFLWEKVGPRALQITEIFHEKKPVPIQANTYASYAMPIIGELLFNQTTIDKNEQLEVIMTNNQLCLAIGSCNSLLFNKKYTQEGWKTSLEELKLNADDKLVKRVVKTNHSKNYQVIRDVKDALVKACVVVWEDTYWYRTSAGKLELADKEYKLKILEAKSYALTKLGCKDIGVVAIRDLHEAFKRLAFEYCKERHDITYFKEASRITSTPTLIRSYIQRIYAAENPKKKLSRKILTSLELKEIKDRMNIRNIYSPTNTLKEESSLEDIQIYIESSNIAALQTAAKLHELFRY